MTSPEPTLPAPILSRPAPLLGPTSASSLLVGGTCLVGGLNAWSAWHRLAVGADYTAGVPGIWVADLTSAEATGRTVATLYLLAMIAAALTLLVWLARGARRVVHQLRARGRAAVPGARRGDPGGPAGAGGREHGVGGAAVRGGSGGDRRDPAGHSLAGAAFGLTARCRATTPKVRLSH